MFKSIMLAVDGSAYTDAVLAYGIDLAKKYTSHLWVLTVADIRIFEWASAVGSDGFISIVPSGSYQDTSKQLLEEKSQKILDKCSDRLVASGVSFSGEKIAGAPVDIIAERAQIADLIILGQRGEFARWEKKALGATVEAVSRLIHKPLLIVKTAYKPIRKILVGYDGSNHANRALQHVAQLAENTPAEVMVICVNDDTELAQHFCKEAMTYLDHYKINAQCSVTGGHPDEQLTKAAVAGAYDLMAIGAYGRSRVREALLGSTTDHILRASPCAVLLAK